MSLSRKAKVLGYGATGGYLSYLSVFTIIGAFVMLCPIGWALAAVFFAVVMEGTVYAINIFKGIENSNTELALKHALVIQKLKQLKKSNPTNPFVKTYEKLKKHLHDLHESNKHDADTAAEIADTTKFLIQLETLAIKYLDNPKVKSEDPTEKKLIDHLTPLITKTEQEQFKTTIFNRSPYMLASKFISFLSGSFSAISASAVMYGHLTSPAGIAILTKIGISTAMATGIIIPLTAILVLMGSGLVMYGTASEIIKKGEADGWFTKIDEFLNSKKTSSIFWRFLKKLAFYVIVGGLIVFSTAATIYSFFAPIISVSTKLMLTTLLMVLAKILAMISFFVTLVFNTENALTSLLKIQKAIINIKDNWNKSTSCFDFMKKFDTFKNDTSWLQILNPLRLVRHLILAAHAYCIGISADNFFSFPPFLVSLLGAIMEWITDFHYIDSKKPKESFSNEKEAEAESELHKHNSSFEKKLENSSVNESDEKEEDDHEHGSLLEIIMIPFNALAARWDYYSANKEERNWENSVAKFFPVAKSPPSSPILPLEFTQYHLSLECDEQIIKYRKQAANKSDMNSLPVKKANAFKELKKTIHNNLQERKSLLELKEYKNYGEYESSSNLPLAQHQNSIRLFKPPPPASFQAVKTILNTAKRWSLSSG